MENPYQDDSVEQVAEHLRLTLALLTKRKITPSPTNYRLAYDYVSGKNEQLNSVLDDHFAHNEQLPEETLWEIYRRFFIQDNAALEKLRQDLRLVISNVQGEYQRSGGELKDFSNKLNAFSSVLGETSDAQQISSEVRKMISDTESVARSQSNLDSQMSSMMDEVEMLRKELEQIKEESLTDALTGIANRKAFDQVLAESMHNAVEAKSPLSLLLIDIDHFKKFNDTYGHLVGDKVLRFLGGTLKRCVKGQDFAARYGGEEFAVILPHTSRTGAKVIAEQIRRSVSAHELQDKTRGENYGRITASIGIAEYQTEETASDLIQRSDKGLYMAKEQGRNRVVLAS